MSLAKIFFLAVTATALLSSCASSKMKERKEQRDRIAQSSKLYCEFVNGDNFPDIEVALNLEMGRRCDNEKPFTLTNYKTPSETIGIVFCCSLSSKAAASLAPEKAPKKSSEKAQDKKSQDTKGESID